MEALDKMWAKKEAFDKEKEKAKEERFMASLEVDKAALELENTTRKSLIRPWQLVPDMI